MIWPPSKPISMRTRSATRNQLREDAVHGLGVDERGLHAEEARPRRGVDQLGALALETRQLRPEVVDLVGDVVHPGAAARQEPPDRCVLVEGGEQLDMARPDA